MAESVVKLLVQKLAREVSIQNNVEKELADIKDEFESMEAFLRDADAKEDGKGNEPLKLWVKQVCDVAYETEDVIDEFKLSHHCQQNPTGFYCYEFIAHFLKALWTRHQLANRIQVIKTTVTEIARRKQTFGLSTWEQGSTSNAAQVARQLDSREDALFLKEAQIVGIDGSRAKLIEWLENNEQNSGLSVVSVYGEGGLGKTTLVKKVFDSQTVIAHFPCRAWITVSETYSITTLLHDLIKKLLNEETATMNVTQLEQSLTKGLQGKRYIVVLDDIWTLGAWEDLKNAFSDDTGCGSRIMITTRFRNIADECVFQNHGLAFPLPYLPLEDAMKLFCKKAFASYDANNCPPNLRKLAQNFLRRCNGLPLAIVSVAALLRTKSPEGWVQVYENLGSLIGSNEKLQNLNFIISMSFNDLSCHLKSCFLYLSIFPEDFLIPCSRLVRLWCAEGFCDGNLGLSSRTTKEDIGRGYLEELVDRSLVLAEELGVTGRVKSCKVHDVMREFIVQKAHEQAFVSHVDRDGLKGQMVGRRLSILDGGNTQNVLSEKVNFHSYLWSFIAFEEGFVLWSRLKLLRVLDLGEIELVEFPIEIVNLFNLRYLRLEGKMESVPFSIGKLRNLEILIIRTSFAEYQLPKEILELNHLRYISGSDFQFPVEIDRLANLESLSRVRLNIEESGEMVERLGRLTQLRKLKIEDVKKEDGMQLCASIEKMEYLRSLRVGAKYMGFEKLDTENLRSPPPHLQKLWLSGCMQTCPSWFPKLDNLIKLTLLGSKIEDDSLLNSIQTLPSLVVLNLQRAFEGEELYFEERGFPRLRQLTLRSLRKLKMVKVEQGAMPCIQKISFIYCQELKKVPVGIEHLTTLKSIEAISMPHKFKEEIKSQIWKAGHAPLIQIS